MVACLGLALPQPAPSSAGPGPCANKTREGEVLVVSNNIFAVNPNTNIAPRMSRFVTRMHDMLITEAQVGAPDVVLVQEVRKSSANKVRDLLTTTFGCTFAIPPNASALKAGFKWQKKYTHLLIQDTAVIYNTQTMSSTGGGQITNSYALQHAAEKNNKTSVNVRRAAWATLKEKNQPATSDTPVSLAVASVHLARTDNFKTKALSEMYKAKHAEKIAKTLRTKLPDTDQDGVHANATMHVIAGDFNQKKRSEVTIGSEAPAYTKLTKSPYNYTDGVLALHNTFGNPIDYLFSTGNFLAAEDDATWTNDESSSTFYSQHATRWGLIEGEDYTPPTTPGSFDVSPDTAGVLVQWDSSTDTGTGVGAYKLYRRQLPDAENPTPIYTGTDTFFLDPQAGLSDNTTYSYRVQACDQALTPNCSDHSSPIEILTDFTP